MGEDTTCLVTCFAIKRISTITPQEVVQNIFTITPQVVQTKFDQPKRSSLIIPTFQASEKRCFFLHFFSQLVSQLFVFRRGSVSFDKKGAQVVGTPLLPCSQSEDSSEEEEEEEEKEEKAGGMSE